MKQKLRVYRLTALAAGVIWLLPYSAWAVGNNMAGNGNVSQPASVNPPGAMNPNAVDTIQNSGAGMPDMLLKPNDLALPASIPGSVASPLTGDGGQGLSSEITPAGQEVASPVAQDPKSRAQTNIAVQNKDTLAGPTLHSAKIGLQAAQASMANVTGVDAKNDLGGALTAGRKAFDQAGHNQAVESLLPLVSASGGAGLPLQAPSEMRKGPEGEQALEKPALVKSNTPSRVSRLLGALFGVFGGLIAGWMVGILAASFGVRLDNHPFLTPVVGGVWGSVVGYFHEKNALAASTLGSLLGLLMGLLAGLIGSIGWAMVLGAHVPEIEIILEVLVILGGTVGGIGGYLIRDSFYNTVGDLDPNMLAMTTALNVAATTVMSSTSTAMNTTTINNP